MQILKYIFIILTFILLTLLTQVGGLVLLLSITTHSLINNRYKNTLVKISLKFLIFLIMYSVVSFIIVPPVAKMFGRVPLPLQETDHLRPLNKLTFFLNRQYVRPDLRQTIMQVSTEINTRFPGTVVNYLDANFPFFNKFPLVPHLSHNDGRKLDLAFCYIDIKTGHASNDAPSVIGYGINEEPIGHEISTATRCATQGYWQYSFLMKLVPQGNAVHFRFDKERTRALVNMITSEPMVEKLFIEPHLKSRLKLTNTKIRFHGCQAVRHDDHIHLQIK